ncbi:MAG: hypothetical protein J6Y86_04970 [Pseudobutyrivibrio sp.]|nr:hypothetical protein [Pseudobutyrivibrio sp.]
MKNIKKLLGIMMAATILVGCGKSSDDAAKDPSPEAGQTVEDSKEEDAVAAAFGEKTVAENPLSDETKAKLDALDTNYKKVNWDAVYSAPDNEGIVISETAYFDKQDSLHNRLVVAFTNVTDEPVKFSCEGYAQNAEEKVVADIVESDVELGPGITIAIQYDCELEEPSGNIDWRNFTVESSDKTYVPYEPIAELTKDNSDWYSIKVTYNSDSITDSMFIDGYGYVLDKDGHIIGGGEESNTDDTVPLWAESYEGENADVVFFVNIYVQ